MSELVNIFFEMGLCCIFSAGVVLRVRPEITRHGVHDRVSE
jgi:hypothetical protein